MRLVVDAIPPGGVPVSADAATPWAAQAAAHALDAPPSDLAVALRVRAVDGGARVDGTVSCATPQPCGRCGAALTLTLAGPVDLDYRSMPPAGTDPVELSPDDLDVSWFDGHRLDLADVLAEQLGLWLPARILCATEGASRVEAGPCEVPAHDGGPELPKNNPFAALKKKQ